MVHHNDIRYATANLLTKVCHDVLVDPDLQTLTGEIPTWTTLIRQMVQGLASQTLDSEDATK